MINDSAPQVSVIIVTFNSLPSIRDALISLLNSDKSVSFEIIVVDNNSDDGTVDVVREIAPEAKIIINSSNNGFAAACNCGADEADGEYLVFYNPDLMIDETALTILLEFLSATENVGVVSGRMRYPDGNFQATCRKFPTSNNIFMSRGSLLSRIFGNNNIYTLPDYDMATEVEAVAGTFMMINRTLFDKIGKFDERFFMYMEDTDLSYRLNISGYRNYFVPQAGGVHLWGKGSRAGSFKRNFYHHRSVWQYFLKHFPNGFSLIILPLLLCLNLIGKIILPGKKT